MNGTNFFDRQRNDRETLLDTVTAIFINGELTKVAFEVRNELHLHCGEVSLQEVLESSAILVK